MYGPEEDPGWLSLGRREVDDGFIIITITITTRDLDCR